MILRTGISEALLYVVKRRLTFRDVVVLEYVVLGRIVRDTYSWFNLGLSKKEVDKSPAGEVGCHRKHSLIIASIYGSDGRSSNVGSLSGPTTRSSSS